MSTNATVTIPAYSPVHNETMTLDAPAEWHDRIRALSAHTVYGEQWRQGVVDNLWEMSDLVRNGYSAAAYNRLLAAERLAGKIEANFPKDADDVTNQDPPKRRLVAVRVGRRGNRIHAAWSDSASLLPICGTHLASLRTQGTHWSDDIADVTCGTCSRMLCDPFYC